MPRERPHSRFGYRREGPTALIWIISAMTASFVLQLVLSSSWLEGDMGLYRSLGLTVPGLAAGKYWTLITHAFLHRPGFILHAVGNIFLLYYLGRELLPLIGSRRFYGIGTVATIVGGLAWTAVHWRFGGDEYLIGATAAVYALLIVATCFFPQRELNFLLFFIVPVSLKFKHIAFTLIGFDVLGLFSYEIPGVNLPLNLEIAHSAHLGGIAIGYLYYRLFHHASWIADPSQPAGAEFLPGGEPDSGLVPSAPLPASTPPARPDIRVEVDRILDKINSHGLAALTADEKRILDDAKKAITRR